MNRGGAMATSFKRRKPCRSKCCIPHGTELFRHFLLAAGIVVTAGLVLISAHTVRAEDSAEANSRGTPTPQQVKFFESQVRPLLAERCFKCHGPEKQKSELRLDSLVGMLKGGKSGAAIVPGKPAESNLIDAINYRTLEMPPDGKLADEQIELLTKWVEMGGRLAGRRGGASSLGAESGRNNRRRSRVLGVPAGSQAECASNRRN